RFGQHCRGQASRRGRNLRANGPLSADGASLVPVADRRRGLASQQRLWCRPAPAPPSPVRSGASAGLSLVVQSAQHLSLREARLGGRGDDRGGLVAAPLSHAAPAALIESAREQGRESTPADTSFETPVLHFVARGPPERTRSRRPPC